MRLASVALFVLASSSNALALALINPQLAPCGTSSCPNYSAERLNEAYLSDATTDAQRAQMKVIIEKATTSGIIDWPTAASEYFIWRAEILGYKPPQLNPADDPTSDEYKVKAAKTAQESRLAMIQRDQDFRNAAETAIRARLIDPDSARFEWPYRFINGYWKPFLGKRVSGNWTCGRVNARNRLGGYTGSTAFVVVLDDAGTPTYVEMGGSSELDVTNVGCAKAAKNLPPAFAESGKMAEHSREVGSIADELEKLATLRDRGVLTQAEFEAQKTRLLSGLQ